MTTYGRAVSTLNDELNRLASGSNNYPAMSSYLDQAGAAKAWAAAKSVALGSVSDLVGILNVIAGISNRSTWLDLAGVCNKIAGTTGLQAINALQQVSGVTIQTIYNIGDTGPGGGKVIYDAGSILSWGRYIEVAPDTWYNGVYDAGDFRYGISSPVSTSTAIGTAVTNTDALIAQSSSLLYIGKNARNYTGGSKTNWSAPSYGDLQVMYTQRAYMGTYYTAYYYWSSSEWTTNTFGYSFYFVNGFGQHSIKFQYTAMRPVRYFTNSTN